MAMETDKALARTWANAVPLSKFATERAQRLAQGMGVGGDRSEEPFAALSRAVQHHANVRVAFDRAYEETINDLIAGRLVCIGRKSKAYEFQVIDSGFWIGASIDWSGNAANRGRQSLIELRIAESPATALTPPALKQGPGRPSKAAAIRAAIAEYSKSDARLSRPPFERYRAYRAYLTDRGFDLRRESGFKDKTFEKYEREFRLKLGS